MHFLTAGVGGLLVVQVLCSQAWSSQWWFKVMVYVVDTKEGAAVSILAVALIRIVLAYQISLVAGMPGPHLLQLPWPMYFVYLKMTFPNDHPNDKEVTLPPD